MIISSLCFSLPKQMLNSATPIATSERIFYSEVLEICFSIVTCIKQDDVIRMNLSMFQDQVIEENQRHSWLM